MNTGNMIQPSQIPISQQPSASPPDLLSDKAATADDGDSQLREAFTDFVGQTLFGSMLASMRKSVGKPAYMHGGRTEEIFQQQLDQVIVEDVTKSAGDTLVGPMFDLFTMQRSQ